MISNCLKKKDQRSLEITIVVVSAFSHGAAVVMVDDGIGAVLLLLV
jgi:hypothetical protein